MKDTTTWECPITGEVLREGMTQKELLGCDKVEFFYPEFQFAGAIGRMCVWKGNGITLIPVHIQTDLWTWKFVERVRRLVFGERKGVWTGALKNG